MSVLKVTGLSSDISAITVDPAKTLVGGGKSVASPGSIVQVACARSGPARQTINSLTPVVISGLSLSFIPKYADSIILLEAYVATTARYVASYGFFRNGSPVTAPTATNSNEPNMNITIYDGSDPNTNPNDKMYQLYLSYSEPATTTLSRTYDVRATSGWIGALWLMYVNDRVNNDMASFSHLIIKEIAQ